METKNGLKLIVIYDRLIGNTYFGWNSGHKLPKLKKYSLIAWNLLFLTLISINCWFGLMSSFRIKSQFDVNHFRPNITKHSSVVPFLLFNVSYVSNSAQTLIIALFLVVRGHALLDLLNEKEVVKVSHKFERKIGLFLVIVRLLFVLTIFVVSFFIFGIRKESDLKITLLYIYFTIVYFLSTNTLLTVLSLILYKSSIVCHQLNGLSQMDQLSKVFLIVCRIRGSIRRFDSIIGFHNLLILSMNSLLCISNLCMLTIVPEETPLGSGLVVLLALVMVGALCLVCDLIPQSFDHLMIELNNKFGEKIESKSSVEQLSDRLVLLQLNGLRDELCFTAFGLFRINSNTLLSCVALIISYCIVIIQTTTSASNGQPIGFNVTN